MGKSSYVRTLLSLPGLLLACAASADVDLNRLDACADVQRMFDVLRSDGSPGFMRSCHGPRGPIERGIVEKIGASPDDFCFYDIDDVSILRGWSCAAMVGPGAPENELLCYHAVDLADVEEFQQNYASRYAAAENRYLRAAAECPVSTGDATNADSLQLPAMLVFVASFEFGYISQLGAGGTAEGSAVHGFAAFDPALEPTWSGGIEFFAMATGGVPEFDDALPVNGWLIDFDEVDEATELFAEGVRAQGIPIDIRSLYFELDSDARPAASAADKQEVKNRLKRALALDLQQWGFVEMQLDTAAMIEDMQGRLVPSRNAQRPRIDSVDHYRYRGTGLDCTDDGEIMAQLISFMPPDNVRRDYGAVALGLYGIGLCGEDVVTAIALDDYAQQLRDTVIDTLESE